MEIDLSPLVDNWRFLVAGLLTTLLLCVLSIGLGLVLGTAVGIGRSYGGRLADAVLGLYVDTMRAVPVLAVLVWTYFAFPVLIGQSLAPLEAGVLAFGIHLAA
jgi:His/Glu/Gln/Arg/opine family amino acid ABC transporter permease subunit